MSRKLPSEAYELADTYQLGTPIKRCISLGWIILYAGLITIFLLICVIFTIAAFTPPGLDHVFTGCTELIFIGGIAIYVTLLLKVLSHYAYMCTDGFVEVTRKTRKVRHVLHWNEVLSVRVSGGRSLPTYYVTDIYHNKIEVSYHVIWRRCKRAAGEHASIRKQEGHR